ncbi:unnamed protein product [Dibothriocephalus latus]|uniref:Protein SDA1 n=1 Tax=Dibothriocephalus latus TaxID=60516 RepID=A0A3P7LKB9_DIBLA|nr:unnamed protein product [Dibothriocephalus latus]
MGHRVGNKTKKRSKRLERSVENLKRKSERKKQDREITRLMLFAAEASHDQVPPDAILPMVRTITDNFVTDRASAEAITVGLNTIREICSRCPYAVDEDLLSDLVQYRSYRNKNVVTAARSLIRLYRQINPALLPKKEIGRPTVSVKEALTEPVEATTSAAILDGPSRVFGQKPVATGIPGAEVLVESVSEGKLKRKRKRSGRPAKRANMDAGQDALEEDVSEDDDASEEEVDLDDANVNFELSGLSNFQSSKELFPP